MFGILIMLSIAAIAYKAAEMENSHHPLGWAALSVGVYLLAAIFTGLGMCAGIAAQILLLIAIIIIRVLKDHHGALTPANLRKSWRNLFRSTGDHPTCPHCAYNVTGLSKTRGCPECGGSLTVCPRCRHDLAGNSNAIYCPKCGEEQPHPNK